MAVPAIPQRLTAPAPGWTIDADVVVVGSGVAGLTLALRYAGLDPAAKVLVVTKDVLSSGSTRWAQGGIAAVLDPRDTSLWAAGSAACPALSPAPPYACERAPSGCRPVVVQK
ncbi:FAD-dependent oxidoreductase [Streptosporangium sp. NBC_01756]|uniref:FAD-dependent oxidoreductase n=1 Tax=Streptosporangium sp. NBC_01756 TaxID=2975950 RepID=UPI002DDB15E7|nr:FAD-dependent oxidoreductase [Streptosporangium sp. NBC_01756]WSC89997.1 FAD-dependent oxidoreductase [Streptosporangium sp. NBC_01756]